MLAGDLARSPPPQVLARALHGPNTPGATHTHTPLSCAHDARPSARNVPPATFTQGGQLREVGYAGLADRIAACLDAGADPNDRCEATPSGVTPLHAAAQGGHAAVIMLLLDAGAKIEAADQAGCTPLHDAAFCGRPAAISALLAGGAAPHAVDVTGRTPLHLAALSGGAAAVSALLAAAPETQGHRDAAGRTPLELAKTAWLNWAAISALTAPPACAGR